jgi:hypothetical protein
MDRNYTVLILAATLNKQVRRYRGGLRIIHFVGCERQQCIYIQSSEWPTVHIFILRQEVHAQRNNFGAFALLLPLDFQFLSYETDTDHYKACLESDDMII